MVKFNCNDNRNQFTLSYSKKLFPKKFTLKLFLLREEFFFHFLTLLDCYYDLKSFHHIKH